MTNSNSYPSLSNDVTDAEELQNQTTPRPQLRPSRRFRCTDSGNAEMMASMFGHALRYNHSTGQWLIWRGHWWAPDTNESVFRFAKQVARERRQEPGAKVQGTAESKWARSSEFRTRLEAMIKLARTENPLSDNGEGWDSEPMLLGVKNGVVDLNTGKLRPGRQSDRIMTHSDVVFDDSAQCPRWEKFLEEIFGSDRDLIEWIQKIVGYCLTASTEEQAIFLCYGKGANGKSTLLDVLRHVFGGYAYNLPFSAFELRGRSAIPNEIAALKGKRFITAIETNESVELNEGRIKALTGSDAVSARFLYKEFFTFEPTGKFFLAFNHKPTVADDSYGFWRRVRLIPFTEQFSGAQCDLKLTEKLKAEASGILNWAVQGCLMWQAKGLEAPAVVMAASNAYREQSDPLKEFLEDCCEPGRSEVVAVSELRQAYEQWAQANGHQPLNAQAFNSKLEARGFQRIRTGHERKWVWAGIGLRPNSSLSLRSTADDKSLLLSN